METANLQSRRRPIAPGLFTEGEAPQLIGGRRRSDGRLLFPCPTGNAGAEFDPVPLGRNGRLWSFSVQRFRPKSPPYTGPETFEPYAVGYVEIPGQLIVEARLATVAFDLLYIGMPVRLVTVPFAADPDGTVVMTYAFEPAPAGAP